MLENTIAMILGRPGDFIFRNHSTKNSGQNINNNTKNIN